MNSTMRKAGGRRRGPLRLGANWLFEERSGTLSELQPLAEFDNVDKEVAFPHTAALIVGRVFRNSA